jgi:class 3 adenylate cyclase
MAELQSNFSAKSERHLAAILAADIVGFSRRMEHDEIGTLNRLRDIRHNLIEPKVAEHRGRIFKVMGDGFLAEFRSALDAVLCAVDIQRLMVARNLDLPDDDRLQLRIGVNLGDVISEGEDVFGDGVNVAVRLESIAPPGGIYVSRAACDPIRERLAFDFEDLGEHSVKNIARPIQVFGVRIEGVGAPYAKQAETDTAPATVPARRKRIGLLLVALVASVTIAVAALIASHMTALSPRGAETAQTVPDRVAVIAQQNVSPAIKCGGSDEQIIRPLKLLYQAVNARNIDLYAAQWSDDAVYVDAATGKTRPKAEKIANRRSQFASWESVSLTMDRVMVIEHSEEHALVKVIYSMTVKPVGKVAFNQTAITEYYDTICGSDGRWVIKRNVDESR